MMDAYIIHHLMVLFRPDNTAMVDLIFSLTGVPLGSSRLWSHAFFNCLVIISAMANVFVENVLV